MTIGVAPQYIKHALEKEQEQTVWELWSNMYPLMGAGLIKEQPYNEFKDQILKPQKWYVYSDKTFDEIEAEMLDVVSAYERRE